MSISEELREALLSLEEARRREEQQRQMAEALLAGLRTLVMTENSEDLFHNLFDVMRKPLDFEAAFVLIREKEGPLRCVAGSGPLFADLVWHPSDMFERVMAGYPAAVFDTELVDEWRSQPDAIRRAAGSALHFSIHTTERKAIFVCTHPDRAHFSRDHISLARRFSVLASQALQKMESETRIANLEEKLEAEAKIARLNRKLAESEKRLSRARKMEALGLLAGGVAHDLNNILSGIVGYPDLLLMQDDLSRETRSAIKTIKETGLRAAGVVEDLLTVARGVAGTRDIVNLNEIVEQFLHSPEHREHMGIHNDLSIRVNLDPDLLDIKASRIHVKKALMNLTLNACEAIGDKPDRRITLSTENRYVDRPLKGYDHVREGEFAVLHVSDNGAGISPTDLERIFEPFYTKKIMGRSGTGLGLAIVWNTMQDHDGYVDIVTGEEGTTFSLYFPITRETTGDQREHVSVQDYRGNGETILIVDDQENQRKIIGAILTSLGYKTDAVSSGEEAVEYLKDRPVDLVVLDMIMDPGINGREAYRRIIQIHPNQKAIIASGYSMTEEVRAAQKLGAGQYIKKPFTLETLAIAVRDELMRETGDINRFSI